MILFVKSQKCLYIYNQLFFLNFCLSPSLFVVHFTLLLLLFLSVVPLDYFTTSIFSSTDKFVKLLCFRFADTLIKQQLSSLMFVKSTCENRIQRIKEGLDENDAAVS